MQENNRTEKINRNINVLVYPAGTEIAFEIHDALKYTKFITLFGATGVDCHADFVFRNCVAGVPFPDSPDLVDALNGIIKQYDIDFIYPAHDSALKRLSDEREKLDCSIIVSPKPTVDICRSKNATYAFLKGADYLPETYDIKAVGVPGIAEAACDIKSYPVFIKPAVGQGSEGARKIYDIEHLEEALSDGTEYTVSEYLPGKEYTVDCFTDIHGNLRLVNPRTRDRIRAGIAVRSHNLPCTDAVKAIAEDLNSRLSFNGAWFFQLKDNADGVPKLMEMAPRIAGTMGLTRNLGINMPLLTLYNCLGFDVGIMNNGGNILLDRAFISRFKTDIKYSRVYVDFDDTIVVKGKVNACLMMFLYQAKNDGKFISLLTRHSTNIYADLEKYCIPASMFDEIVRMDSTGKKTDYILPDSIFIDDSFAERKRAAEACGVPVFDLDMVESLIDYRV